MEFTVVEDDVVPELDVAVELAELPPVDAPAVDELLVLFVAEVEFVDVEPEVVDVDPELLDPEVLDVVVVEPLEDAASFGPLFEFELEFPELPVGG